MTWLRKFTDLETVRQILINGEKPSSLKEKEIVALTDCLETSLHNVLRLLDDKFIWLFRAFNVDTSLTFPWSTRYRESLPKWGQSRNPFLKVYIWSWAIKTKPFLWQSYFEMSFTLFINNLLTDQHSSRNIKLHMMIFTVLDFLRKMVLSWKMQSVISRGDSVESFLVSHWTAIFYTDNGGGKLMGHQNTLMTRSPPIRKFIAFSKTKNFFHTFWYRASPAMMKSAEKSVLGFVTFIVRQWLWWHSIKCLHPIEVIENNPKPKGDFGKICKVILCNAFYSNLWWY